MAAYETQGEWLAPTAGGRKDVILLRVTNWEVVSQVPAGGFLSQGITPSGSALRIEQIDPHLSVFYPTYAQARAAAVAWLG